MGRPDRLRRSELSTPAASSRMIPKAAASAADTVILDLEDSVPPELKQEARASVVEAFTTLDFGRSTRAYRINGVHTHWCHRDVIDVVTHAGANVDLIVIPKVRGPRDVWFVDDLLTQLESELGLEPGRIGLEVFIEDVEALIDVNDIARCSRRLEALVLGMGDLAASQGMRLGHVGSTSGGASQYPGDVWHYARFQVITAARAAGLDAIDGPVADFADTNAFEQSAATFSVLGGVGKWCIHPSQIAPANSIFAPSADEIAQAQEAIAAVQSAEAEGRGAASLNGVMIDAATTRIFQSLLQRAHDCGVI